MNIADIRAMPIAGNAWQDRPIFDACHAIITDKAAPIADRLAALDHISVVMGEPCAPATAADLADYLGECE